MLMAARYSGFVLFALAAAFPVAASADEASPFDGIPGIRFETYDIEGTTPTEIYASMHARGPQSDDGEGVARTEWRLRANWQEVRRGRECRVVDPISSVSIRVLLPRLVTRTVTPEGLDFWQRSLRGLQIHEAGHARIAYDHRDDFLALAEKARCDQIKALAAKVEARVGKLQAAYDRETRHGIKQVPVR